MSNLESVNEFSQHLRLNNILQIELAKMKDTETETVLDSDLSGSKLSEWINNYSEKFREIISKKSSENSNFWNDLEDIELRKEILKNIAIELYSEPDSDLEKIAA